MYQNDLIKIEIEKHQVPWIKIFTIKKIKEFSQCDTNTKLEILDILDICEKLMLKYYNPKKINIASFGNYMPHVHFHIQARFEDDDYFPEPLWGQKQRENKLNLPSFDIFCDLLKEKLQNRTK